MFHKKNIVASKNTVQDLRIFKKYHNCDAIDIPKSSMIPYNCNGVMGVPITYLENFDYDMFEIVGLGKGGMFDNTFKYDNPIMVSKNYKQYSSFNDYLMLFSEENLKELIISQTMLKDI